jgi:hypothetical protein
MGYHVHHNSTAHPPRIDNKLLFVPPAPPFSLFITANNPHSAPILASLPLKYTSQIFNGSLLAPTIFRAPFGPEVDAAWDSLGVNYRPLAIPPRLAQKSGLTKDQVKINQKYGGGFPGNVEGLHHLHCLNLLRQTLWWNFNYYNEKGEGAFKNEPYILQMHTSPPPLSFLVCSSFLLSLLINREIAHCLDIIRQQLMCQVDIGVLGQVWIHPEAPETYVDFNTKHQCRDFEAVRKWAEERQMPVEEELPGDWLEPPKMGDRVYEVIP